MPLNPPKLPFVARSIRPALVLVLVAGAHWAVLGASSSPLANSAPAMAFEMRMLPAAGGPPDTKNGAPTPSPKTALSRVQVEKAAPAVSTTPTAPAASPVVETPAEPNSSVQVAAATVEEPVVAAKAASAVANARTPQLPQSARLFYDIKGETKRIPISAKGELHWRQDGKTYDAKLEISIFLLGSRIQTSKGLVTAQGLEPVRFGDKVRSEVAAHFERGKGKVTYSANTPDEALQPGAQDQLSIFFQLAGLLAANAEQYPAGSNLRFQAVGPRSSETWVFKVDAPDFVTLPGGKVRAIRLSKDPVSEYDSRAELWLAPDMEYLPVRIRLTQANGDMVDQLWRATERPVAAP